MIISTAFVSPSRTRDAPTSAHPPVAQTIAPWGSPLDWTGTPGAIVRATGGRAGGPVGHPSWAKALAPMGHCTRHWRTGRGAWGVALLGQGLGPQGPLYAPLADGQGGPGGYLSWAKALAPRSHRTRHWQTGRGGGTPRAIVRATGGRAGGPGEYPPGQLYAPLADGQGGPGIPP